MKALLVIDIQNDFCPGGALSVKDGDAVVEPVNRLIAFFEETDSPVFFTRDWHPADHSSFSDFGGIWPAHCIAGTEGADFHPELQVPKAANIISKADSADKDAYSGFEGTELDSELKSLGVDEVIIAGLATDYCVKNTVIDALGLGYSTTVVKDGIRAVEVEPGDGKKAADEMAAAGAVFADSGSLI